MNAKLVVVTRDDLTMEQQTVQSCHAAIDFIFQHPARASPWHDESNYLVLLSVKDEQSLKELIHSCEIRELAHTVFREPDLDNQITAIAIEPSMETQKLVKKIKLLSFTPKI